MPGFVNPIQFWSKGYSDHVVFRNSWSSFWFSSSLSFTGRSGKSFVDNTFRFDDFKDQFGIGMEQHCNHVDKGMRMLRQKFEMKILRLILEMQTIKGLIHTAQYIRSLKWGTEWCQNSQRKHLNNAVSLTQSEKRQVTTNKNGQTSNWNKVLGFTISVEIFKYLAPNMKFCSKQSAWLLNTKNTRYNKANITHEVHHEHHSTIWISDQFEQNI